MSNRTIYTDDVLQNLDNYTETRLKNTEMNDQIKLINFVDIWLDLFKKNSIKEASLARLIVSRKALEDYAIAQMKIGDISFFDIQKYINSLVDAGYSMSGIKKQTLIVTAPLKQAAAMQVISADPCVGIKMPVEMKVKKKNRPIVAYTKEEQERLFKEIQAHPSSVGYLAVGFMIETGVRSGELMALKWSDIELDRCRMWIHATIINPMYNTAAYQNSPKSKSSNRTIPLTPKAIGILKKLQKTRTTEWVFEEDGERYSYRRLVYQTKKLCRTAKVAYYGEHVFRHTFATNCYYKGIDVKILSRLMGHSSVQVTYNTYINLYGDGFDTMYAALCF